MSYTLTKRYGGRTRTPGRGALGGLTDLVVAGVNVANDPYLGEVMCHLNQLQVIKAGGEAGPCAKTPPGISGGIGLSRAVVPMRAYVYAEGHKWVYALAAAGILGLPFLLGYRIGKG